MIITLLIGLLLYLVVFIATFPAVQASTTSSVLNKCYRMSSFMAVFRLLILPCIVIGRINAGGSLALLPIAIFLSAVLADAFYFLWCCYTGQKHTSLITTPGNNLFSILPAHARPILWAYYLTTAALAGFVSLVLILTS